MFIRDRIRELRRVPASELLPNPRNWRTHPQRQREALQAVLAEIGYADALLARETAEGRLMLIDGHLRAETTPQTTVPVLVVDVSEAEADKLLATLDPLAALAETNSEKLSQLLGSLQIESAALRDMLAELVPPTLSPPDTEPEPQSLHPQYNIIITCDDEQQQVDLLGRFTEEGLTCRALIV